MRRENILKIRLSDAEHEAIFDLAREHRMSAADLVRNAILGPKASLKLPSRDILKRILRQVAGMATNVNQIAMRANAAAKSNAAMDWSSTIDEIDQIAAEISDLRRKLYEALAHREPPSNDYQTDAN